MQRIFNKDTKKSMKNMKTNSRRDFLKKSVLASASLLAVPSLLQASLMGWKIWLLNQPMMKLG